MDNEEYKKHLENLDLCCSKLRSFNALCNHHYERGRDSMLKDLIRSKQNIPDDERSKPVIKPTSEFISKTNE